MPKSTEGKPLRLDPNAGWLKAGLEKHKGSGKSQRGLARFLDVDDATIHRMVNGGRFIRHEELQRIAVYLGEPLPAGAIRTVPVRGVLVEGAWRIKMQEQAIKPSQEKVAAIPHRIPPEKQFAYELMTPGQPTAIEYFVAPEDLGRPIREGDKVLVLQERGDMVREVTGLIQYANAGFQVYLEGGAPSAVLLSHLILLGVSLGTFLPRDV